MRGISTPPKSLSNAIYHVSRTTNSCDCFFGVRDGSNPDLMRVAREIYDACTDYGFFYLKNHGIPQQTIDGMVKTASDFLRCPSK